MIAFAIEDRGQEGDRPSVDRLNEDLRDRDAEDEMQAASSQKLVPAVLVLALVLAVTR